MLYINKIPHLRVYRQKTFLPVDNKTQSMYGLAFLNSNTIDGSVALMTSQIAYHNNKYHTYYMNHIYNMKLFASTVNDINVKERDTNYEIIEKKVRGVKPERSFSNVNKRNVYVDLFKLNQLFLTKSRKVSSYKQKVKEYLLLLKNEFSKSDYNVYKEKVMLINIDDWVDNIKTSINTKNLDNPIMYIYYALLKKMTELNELGNIDIIFVTDNQSLRFNPSLIDKNTAIKFRTEITKMKSNSLSETDEDIDTEVDKKELYKKVARNFSQHFNFVGDDEEVDEDIEEELEERIASIDQDDDSDEEDEEATTGKDLEKKLTNKIINDEKILKDIYNMTQSKKTGKTAISTKRDEELREKQKEIKLKNLTVEEAKRIDGRKITLEKTDVSEKVNTTNKNVTSIKYPSFEKTYNEHLYYSDMLNIISSLNDASIPVLIRNIEINDSSDEMNFKETITVHLEDTNRVRHTLKFDMPKFIDDKFMYLNGNKKMIVKQLFMKPIVKTSPNNVKITSNYKKMFVARYGTKVSAKIERFKKVLTKTTKGLVVKYGNNSAINSNYKGSIEYDDISRTISYVKVGKAEFHFNQEEVHNLLKERKIKINDNKFCIGFFDKKDPITVDNDTQLISGSSMDIIDLIMSYATKELVQEFDSATAGKKFIYTRAFIMKKQVPLAILIGYYEGISGLLRRAEIQHYFTDTRPKIDTTKQGSIQFANGYLVFDRFPFENSLLMNAFADIPTKAFTYEELDEKDAYVTIFEAMFKRRNIANTFDNFKDFFVDPITREVLEDLNQPTDISGILLYANKLLTDNAHVEENDMNNYRVRSNEIVNTYLYDAITSAYHNYKTTANNNNPVKISIQPDKVIKDILMSSTIEDYSILNPIVEVEKSRAITPKGPQGLNLANAYTQDKRSYDKSMLGLLSISTSPDANVGVVRQLTMEPNIIGPRGYIEIKDDKLDELSDANLFSPAEMLTPLGVSRDKYYCPTM